jgi:hypothetical protein
MAPRTIVIYPMGFVRRGMQRVGSKRRVSGWCEQDEGGAGERGEEFHPEEEAVEAGGAGFAGSEALAGDDEPAVGHGAAREGNADAELGLPGDFELAALMDGVEDAVGWLREGAVIGGVAR